MLLKADQGGRWAGLGGPGDCRSGRGAPVTVARVRRQFVEQGLEAALNRRPPRREYRRSGTAQEAHLIALACSAPPEGHGCWSLRLWGDKLVEVEVVREAMEAGASIRAWLGAGPLTAPQQPQQENIAAGDGRRTGDGAQHAGEPPWRGSRQPARATT
jgi:hypothetical protein